MPETISIQKKKRSISTNPVFSILIPTWNNLAYLQLCIDAIRRNSHYNHQIIVHVNDGSDGSLEWVQSRQDLDYTHSGKNIGVCHALNAASALVDTDYIVYMNDDMYACPEWDKALLDEINDAGHNNFFFSATAIEPMATHNNCVIVQNYGTDISSFHEGKLLHEFDSLQKEDWLGATWPPNVLHKDIWNLVGGYSVEFSPGMYSDPDFSMKLWQLGIRLFKGVSKSRVYHFGSKSTGRVIRNKGYYTFIAKWGMTAGSFTRYYLRSGALFTGPLMTPVIPSTLRWKNLFKRFVAAFQKQK